MSIGTLVGATRHTSGVGVLVALIQPAALVEVGLGPTHCAVLVIRGVFVAVTSLVGVFDDGVAVETTTVLLDLGVSVFPGCSVAVAAGVLVLGATLVAVGTSVLVASSKVGVLLGTGVLLGCMTVAVGP